MKLEAFASGISSYVENDPKDKEDAQSEVIKYFIPQLTVN